MIRVAAFIDGFNMYHSLKDKQLNTLKWLNYWTLADAFIAKSREQLVNVFYFTAIVPWDTAKANRHKIFIRAQEYYGTTIIFGKFKEVTRTCRTCGCRYKTFEEKETDVNIAVTMLYEASIDTFDKALLFSGDSDMIAGVKALRRLAPHKHIQVVVPFGRSAIDLENICDSSARVKLKHLQNNQFPESLESPAGSGNYLRCPSEWQ
jgi:uncharacterized LabA/DUF88 family protein